MTVKPSAPTWPGPPEIRLAHVILFGEAATKARLDTATWDAKRNVILARGKHAADLLRPLVKAGVRVAGVEQAPRWCLAGTKGQQEKLAKENLRREGFEVYLPVHQVEERPKGQAARIVTRPFFPRYLFVRVEMEREAEAWAKLYTTRGVQSVLSVAGRPIPVPEHVVEDIKARELNGQIQMAASAADCPWVEGDKVTYNGLIEAIFHEVVDDRRALILVSLLGSDSLQTVDITRLS